MSKKWKYILLAIGIALIWGGVKLYQQEPEESKERIKIAIQETATVKSVNSFMEDLKIKKCWIIGDWIFAAANLPETEKLICMVSADEKETKPLVFPKARMP